MKKILKLSILLFGALFVLLGCSSEKKSEFIFDFSDIKQKIIYVYDKEKDSVSSITFNLVYDISKSKEIEERARSTQKLIVDDANGIEGVKVTQSDSAKELSITIEVDAKKFNYDDEKIAAKAPMLYSSIHAALVKKNDHYSFEESKKKILEEGFKEVK